MEAFHHSILLFLLMLLAAPYVYDAQAQLSYGFYSSSCPGVESTVRSIFASSLFGSPTLPAAMTRLAFHDCQVQGCDASILLDSTELSVRGNLGIRRLDFIDRVKAALESSCPGVVSCADIIALAGRDAVNLAGGPRITIPLGRRDATSSSAAAAQQALPPPTITVDQLLSIFGGMGMSSVESVAIIGAHTLGIAHCPSIVDRLYPNKDPNLNVFMYSALRVVCPPQFNAAAFANLDLTSIIFDNQYFRDIMSGRGLLTIDSELGSDPRTSSIVAQFASNRNLFFQAFSSAYVKMTSFQVLTGTQGEVRSNCRRVNGS